MDLSEGVALAVALNSSDLRCQAGHGARSKTEWEGDAGYAGTVICWSDACMHLRHCPEFNFSA